MKRLTYFAVAIFCLGFLGLGVMAVINSDFFKKEPAKDLELVTGCFGDNCFRLRTALTEKERETGLMNQDQLAKDEGMLFIFPESGKYYFWMKNTLIPLDIIWLDEEGKIVFIKELAVPCGEDESACPQFISAVPARYVVELNAGLSRELDLKIGGKFRLQ